MIGSAPGFNEMVSCRLSCNVLFRIVQIIINFVFNLSLGWNEFHNSVGLIARSLAVAQHDASVCKSFIYALAHVVVARVCFWLKPEREHGPQIDAFSGFIIQKLGEIFCSVIIPDIFGGGRHQFGVVSVSHVAVVSHNLFRICAD